MDFDNAPTQRTSGSNGLRTVVIGTAVFSALLASFLFRAIAKRLWWDDSGTEPVAEHIVKDGEPSAPSDWETTIPPR